MHIRETGMKRLFFIPCFFVLLLLAGWGEPNLITVDAGARGAPISRYIYGQFIEHLGKGVYGGLWAEMLEDRKFFYSVNDTYDPWGTASDSNWGSGPFNYLKASPWKIVGPAGTVYMDIVKPYTDVHTPSVRLPADGSPAGISQEGLALEKGRAYTGRIVLAADPGVAVVVRFVGDSSQVTEIAIGQPGRGYTTFPFQFIAPDSSDNARLEILGKGKGSFKIGTVSLMPADAIDGWRRDVVSLLKELDAPIYRWPGGNFVSGYDWRDGIGERDTRPPRQNPAWRGVESNDVGIHEFMDLMSIIDAEAYIALNAGLGTVDSAEDEVAYCVGAVDTPMGKLRAANGHPEPFPVTWWAVGNEMLLPASLIFQTSPV
jgi:alpha-N-arabinofuranosidase